MKKHPGSAGPGRGHKTPSQTRFEERRMTVWPWAWLPARLWRCPRCSTTILTREAGPRCPRCGFVEGT